MRGRDAIKRNQFAAALARDLGGQPGQTIGYAADLRYLGIGEANGKAISPGGHQRDKFHQQDARLWRSLADLPNDAGHIFGQRCLALCGDGSGRGPGSAKIVLALGLAATRAARHADGLVKSKSAKPRYNIHSQRFIKTPRPLFCASLPLYRIVLTRFHAISCDKA